MKQVRIGDTYHSWIATAGVISCLLFLCLCFFLGFWQIVTWIF